MIKLVLLAVLLCGCQLGTAPTPEAEPPEARGTPTASPTETALMEWTDAFSNVEQPGARLATSKKEWQKLWEEIGRSPVPDADLDAYFAAAVFLGQRSTGGYSVKLLDPVVRDGKLVIPYREHKPTGVVFQAITYPFAVRLYPKTDLPVVLEAAR